MNDNELARLSIEERKAHTYTTRLEADIVAHDLAEVARMDEEFKREQHEEWLLWLEAQADHEHEWQTR
jgi:hypothetical protein